MSQKDQFYLSLYLLKPFLGLRLLMLNMWFFCYIINTITTHCILTPVMVKKGEFFFRCGGEGESRKKKKQWKWTLQMCYSRKCIITVQPANYNVIWATVRRSWEQWCLVSMITANKMCVGAETTCVWCVTHSWFWLDKNFRGCNGSWLAILHFGHWGLHEVFERPQSLLQSRADLRRWTSDAFYQCGIESDHLSPGIPIHCRNTCRRSERKKERKKKGGGIKAAKWIM